MIAGHGPNIGHGFVKYIIINDDGYELPPIVFPAQIAPARGAVAGTLYRTLVVSVGGERYWTGDDADLADSPITMLAQSRLNDAAFIPALASGALARFGGLNGSASGVCVTGLPATWANDADKARALGQRLRAAHPGYTRIQVIPECLGPLYAALLSNDGEVIGDSVLRCGTVGIVDIGHLTVDIAIVQRMTPAPASLNTWQMGTAQALGHVRAYLSATLDRELSIHETDRAIRARSVRVGGRETPLPAGWDRPIIEHAAQLTARLVEAWGSGARLDTILLGGGGAEVAPIVAAITERFPQAVVMPDPQLTIARGYARLARRLGMTT